MKYLILLYHGYESKHNLQYWKQGEYYGFGAGASSFLENKRYTNVASVKEYIAKINKKEEVSILEEELSEEGKINEYMLLRLRLTEGIDILETNEKFQTDILKRYATSLAKLKSYGLITITDKIALTTKGLDLANVVWEEFV